MSINYRNKWMLTGTNKITDNLKLIAENVNVYQRLTRRNIIFIIYLIHCEEPVDLFMSMLYELVILSQHQIYKRLRIYGSGKATVMD